MSLQAMYQAKSNSPQTTLTAQIAADATTLTVFDGSVLPQSPNLPNLLTLGSDENAEVVLYTTINGNTVSGLVRGYSGTTASVWPEGTPVSREFTSYDHDTFISNIESLQDDVDALDTEMDGKQNTLTFDTTPTASSTNPVTSGGIKTYTDQKILYFYQQSTSVTSASTAEFCRITDSRINTDTVVLNMSFSDSSYITSGISWSSAAGYISLKGICTNSNCKVNIVLGQKGN